VTPQQATSGTTLGPVGPVASTNPLSWPHQPSTGPYFATGKKSNTPGRHAKFLQRALRLPFFDLAKNAFERAAVESMGKFCLPGFLLPADSRKKEFLFRYIYLPSFALALIKLNTKRGGSIPLWLATPATYVIAARRALMEMALLDRPELECQDNDINENLFALPGLRIDNWKNQIEAFPFESWIERFEKFRQAAEKSYYRYMGARCPDIKDLAMPHKQNAAFWGAIANISGLPNVCDGEIVHRIMQNGSDVEKVFYKNALELPQIKSTPLKTGGPHPLDH